MADSGTSRRMLYPYTWSAKLVQFPHKYIYKHSWLYRWFPIGLLVTFPIFYKIQKLSYAPENVKKWRDIDYKTFYGGDHH